MVELPCVCVCACVSVEREIAFRDIFFMHIFKYLLIFDYKG